MSAEPFTCTRDLDSARVRVSGSDSATEAKGPTMSDTRIAYGHRAAHIVRHATAPTDWFVCDSTCVVDSPDYTTRARLDAPTGGWVAAHDAVTDTYVARYPAMSNRPRTYRRV